MSGFKRQRVGELVRNFLAQELRNYDDPRFLGVSLTAVELSPDLKFARVFWSLFSAQASPQQASPQQGSGATPMSPSARAIGDTQRALEGIENELKRRIAGELNLRYTPKLTFAFDPTIETTARLDALLKSVGE